MDEIRSVRIGSRPSGPLFRRENFFLLDPDKPLADPNELAKQARDPNAIMHGCAYCHRVLPWDEFAAHFLPCAREWRRVRLDITRKTFTGATPEVESA